MTLTLTLDRVIRHTIVFHLSTSSYIPNFIRIGKTFCGWTDGRTSETHFIRSTLRSRPKNNWQKRNCSTSYITNDDYDANNKCRRYWTKHSPQCCLKTSLKAELIWGAMPAASPQTNTYTQDFITAICLIYTLTCISLNVDNLTFVLWLKRIVLTNCSVVNGMTLIQANAVQFLLKPESEP